MSRTELYVVKKDGELYLHKEFSNSHRGALMLWDNLAEKYLNRKFASLLFNKDVKPVWKLDRDLNVPEDLRILLMSTYDWFMIRRENLPLFVTSIRNVLEGKYFKDMGHFEYYPEVLEEIYKMDDVVAIAWNQTSVVCDMWNIYEECPTCGECNQQRGYNIYKDNKHTFLYEYLTFINQELEKKFK